MTPRLKNVLILAALTLWAGQALGEASPVADKDSKLPFEVVRSIEAIQDQIVLGNQSAKIRLPKVIVQLTQRLMAASAETWRDPRNVQALTIYGLSGGSPRALRKVIESGICTGPDLELLRGSLAYAEGRDAEAKLLLTRIEASSFPAAIGGHLALAQAVLIAKDNPHGAIKLLDQARIWAPGSLVEETALRREIVIAGDLGDLDKFRALVMEYFWRFPSSVYAESFRQRVAAAAIQLGLASDPANFAKIEMLAAELDQPNRLKFYLLIAKKSLVAGKARLARLAASEAVELAQYRSAERAEARLIEGAALVLTNNYETGFSELKALDAQDLPKEDLALKEAITSLTSAITGDPGAERRAAISEPDVGNSTMFPEAQRAINSASELIGGIEEQLAQTRTALDR